MTSVNASSSMSSNEPAARVPRLAGINGGAGITYALWRPQMRTFLMRQGVKESDYAVEIAEWATLVQRVEDDEQAEERNAIALLLGNAQSSSASSGSSTKTKKENPPSAGVVSVDEPQTAATKLVASLIARSRKAFGFLYAALPSELCQLVADVPQGYAFGIWSFLEKRFRNTEQDSVATLWANFTPLVQEPDEDFVTYKARVDSVVELLTHAKQKVPSGLYASIVTLKLQPRYMQVVLALQMAGKLTDTDAIDWRAVTEMIGQFERKQNDLTDANNGGSAMIARRGGLSRGPEQQWSSTQLSKKDKKQQHSPITHRDMDDICYNCEQPGHYSSSCPKPPTKRTLRAQAAKAAKIAAAAATTDAKGGQPPSANLKTEKSKAASASHSSSEDESEGHSRTKARGYVARGHNPYATLAQLDKINESTVTGLTHVCRTYAAVARAYGSQTPIATEEMRMQSAMKAARAVDFKSKVPLTRDSADRNAEKSLDETLKTTGKAVDTAANVHLTCCRESLHSVVRCEPMPVKMADGTVVWATHKGKLTMRLQTTDKSRLVKVTLNHVYYHERFDVNLLSWDLLDKAGWEMRGKGGRMTLVTPGGTCVEVKRQGTGGLAILEDVLPQRAYSVNNVICATSKELTQLHRRLGHISWGRLLQTCKAGLTVGVGDLHSMSVAEVNKAESAVKECTHCVAAKAHRKALGHEGVDKGAEAGSVLHMDSAPIIVLDPTTGTKRTLPLLSVKDSFTEWWWAVFATHMRGLQQEVIDVIEHSHTLTGRYPRLIIADLGTEFNNGVVLDFCRRHGIQYQPSPARAKELNGLAEKGVDTLKNHARAMIYGAGIDPNASEMYTMSAFLHFVYVWNRTHIGRRTEMTPYQSMTGREASVLNVGEFGCDAYVHQHRDTRHTTLSRKAEPGIYLGHDGRQNCPRVLLLRSGKTVLSKDVTFREGSFLHSRAYAEGRGDQVEVTNVDVSDTDSAEPKPAMNESALAEADETEELLTSAGESVTTTETKRYTLDYISDTRLVGGVKQYQCKWVGYRAKSWEPADIIEEDDPDAVREFEAECNRRAAARATGPVTRRSAAVSKLPSDSSSAVTVLTRTGADGAVPTVASSTSNDTAADSDDESEARVAAAYAARRL